MNKERMLQLADFLDSLDRSKFDLRCFFAEKDLTEDGEVVFDYEGEEQIHGVTTRYFIRKEDEGSCNTTACIAGWAIYLFKEDLSQDQLRESNHISVASDILGLNSDEAPQLFYADRSTLWYRCSEYFGLDVADDLDSILRWSDIHPKYASEMIRMLVNEEISFTNYK